MDANYILKIDVAEFFKSASQADCESLLADVRIYEDKMRTLASTLVSRIKSLQEKAAREKFSDICEGDKVIVEYAQRNWRTGKEETFTTEPMFFYNISQRAEETVYMREGPYLNLAKPKKDGSMGKRYQSIRAKYVTKITKV